MARLIKKLTSIFTKNEDSEVGYLTGAVEDSLDEVLDALSDAEIQSVITSATGLWLDTWGEKFGVVREQNETDASYRIRILASVTDKKGTIPALIAAVKRALGNDTIVVPEETYEDLRIFNISTYSGTGKYQDSEVTRLGVIRLKISKEPNTKLAEEIWRSKASGTRVIIIPVTDGSLTAP